MHGGKRLSEVSHRRSEAVTSLGCKSVAGAIDGSCEKFWYGFKAARFAGRSRRRAGPGLRPAADVLGLRPQRRGEARRTARNMGKPRGRRVGRQIRGFEFGGGMTPPAGTLTSGMGGAIPSPSSR